MLNKGEELFEFESEFFKVTKKWFEMDKVGSQGLDMTIELDNLLKRYSGINKLYDEYVKTRIEWFITMIVRKERFEDGEL